MKNKFFLRIISGKYRGKGIFSPEDCSIRPTSSRVKDSLFNIIRTDLFDSDFLDLFGGSGQIGLEAASLGAKVTIADRDISLVEKNVAHVGADDVRTIQGDYLSVLNRLQNQKFDFIFADPPYKDGLYGEIIKNALPMLKEGGLLILEHASEDTITDEHIVKVKKYGSRTLTFLGDNK